MSEDARGTANKQFLLKQGYSKVMQQQASLHLENLGCKSFVVLLKKVNLNLDCEICLEKILMLVRRRPCKHLVVLDFQDKFVKLKDNFYFSMIVLKCLNLNNCWQTSKCVCCLYPSIRISERYAFSTIVS